MTLGARLNQVLARMMLFQEGAVIDYTKDHISHGEGGHGTHGERGGRPAGASRPLSIQWAERFERWIQAAERDAQTYERGADATSPFTGKGPSLTELKRRVRDYSGRDPVFVAFMEGCSVELVRKARRELGLHTVSGDTFQRDEKPLTAPPSESLTVVAPAEGDALVFATGTNIVVRVVGTQS